MLQILAVRRFRPWKPTQNLPVSEALWSLFGHIYIYIYVYIVLLFTIDWLHISNSCIPFFYYKSLYSVTTGNDYSKSMPQNMHIMRMTQEFDYVCINLTFWDRLMVAHWWPSNDCKVKSHLMGYSSKDSSFKAWQTVTNRDRLVTKIV